MKNNREISQISLPEWQRRQCWDEEVRMQSSFYEDEHGARVAWYGYDDGGERAVKLSGECVALTQNVHTTTMASLTNPVVYVSPLVTLTRRGYTNVAEVESRGILLAMPRQGNVYGVNVAEVESRGILLAMPRQGNVYGVKHYFEGERRICSAIGGCAVKPCLITAVFESAERSSTTAGTARVPFSAPDGRYRKHPQDAFFTHVEWDSIDASQDKVVAPICDELFPLLDDGVEEAMHCVELNDIHLSGRLIYRMLWLEATKPHDDPEPVYYYHNDHLGGTAYLTDQTGQVAQTLAYLPYGEDWVDVTTFQYDTSQIGFYQFNDKEKDPETDYLYYGARYHWPDAWNGWLSPDPIMDDYPNISPYAYCNWNPVNLVDPDGMETDDWEINDAGEVVNHIENKNKDAFYRVNGNGDRLAGKDNSVEFKYGTIESHIERNYSYKNLKGIYDVFQVRGDDNGEMLFKFLANTVQEQGIEVSHIKCGIEGEKGLNFVSTGHFKPVTEVREDGSAHLIASEPSQSYLWNGRLQFGYTIREINHSHPFSSVPSDSDLIMASQIRKIYAYIKHKPAPNLNIYFTKDNRYIPY